MASSYGWSEEYTLCCVDWDILVALQPLIREREHHDKEFEATLHDKMLQLNAATTARLPGESQADHERSVAAHNAMTELFNDPNLAI